MKNDCLEAVEQELTTAGVPYRVDFTAKHVHIRYGEEYQHLHVVAKTASDVRAHKNERALIRRELVRLGYVDNSEPSTDGGLVSLHDGRPVCSSIALAEKFSKQHKNILRAIDQVRQQCGPEFDRLNFAPISYADESGRTYRAYEMTRDGFSLVAMGFTGATATKWKIDYIDAFNAMEREIRGLRPSDEIAALRGDVEAMFDIVASLPPPQRRQNNAWLMRSIARRSNRRQSARYAKAMGVAE